MGCSASKATDSVASRAHTQATASKKKDAIPHQPETDPNGQKTFSPAVEAQSAVLQTAVKKEEDSLPPAERVFGDVPADATILFVLGGPGSGKGTQCNKLVEKFSYCHLSAGDLLRDEVKKGSELGQTLEALMKEGKLVPSGATIALLRNAMIRSSKKTFLIDGFPRALDQAHSFEEEIKVPRGVIFFDCPEDVMEVRLLSRGKTSGRSDDQIETIKKRFITYQESTLPAISYYREKGLLHHISAVPGPDEVFAATLKSLEKAGLVQEQEADAIQNPLDKDSIVASETALKENAAENLKDAREEKAAEEPRTLQEEPATTLSHVDTVAGTSGPSSSAPGTEGTHPSGNPKSAEESLKVSAGASSEAVIQDGSVPVPVEGAVTYEDRQQEVASVRPLGHVEISQATSGGSGSASRRSVQSHEIRLTNSLNLRDEEDSIGNLTKTAPAPVSSPDVIVEDSPYGTPVASPGPISSEVVQEVTSA
eukprot:jgi/Botrbrau1/6621/Bobra.104_2s0008.1